MIRLKPKFFKCLCSNKNAPTKYKAMVSWYRVWFSVPQYIWSHNYIFKQALSTCSFRVIFNKTCPLFIGWWNLIQFLLNLSLICYQQTPMIYEIYGSCVLYFLKETVFCFPWRTDGFLLFYNISFSNKYGSFIIFVIIYFLLDVHFCYFPLLCVFESCSIHALCKFYFKK